MTNKYNNHNLNKLNYDTYLSLNDKDRIDFFRMMEYDELGDILKESSPKVTAQALVSETATSQASVIFVNNFVIVFGNDNDAIQAVLNRLFDDGFVLQRNTSKYSEKLLYAVKANANFKPATIYKVYDVIALSSPICLS